MNLENKGRNIFDDFTTIYSWLEDDKSKKIFLRRLQYLITKDKVELEELLKCVEGRIGNVARIKNIVDAQLKDKENVIFYGAGFSGQYYYDILKASNPDINIIFCDRNYKDIKEIKGSKVISLEEVRDRYKRCKIVITTWHFFEEILEQLLEQGIDRANIFKWENPVVIDQENQENQYFEEEIIKFTEDEVFVDAGAYDGHSAILFSNKCKGSYKKIYLFEPDSQNVIKVNENTMLLKDAEVHNIGLWDKEDELEFANDHTQGSTILHDEVDTKTRANNNIGGNCFTESIKIKVNSIDNICYEDAVTFIKMDIEGAELKALQGAKNTIIKNKPKLAICMYHKPEDMVELPLYIKELVPEYKLYIRHYSAYELETVLYAVIE